MAHSVPGKDSQTSAARAGGPAGGGPSPAVMATYARQDVVFERGEGSWLVATDGGRYLDFGSGVAVNALGHAHPALIAALTEQAHKVWHTSNLYRVAGQERLAERLCAASFAERVFFCNSGAEACEGAIKTARRYQFVSGRPERNRIITFQGAFHGRTLATLAAAGNIKYLEGFAPDMPGFTVVPPRDRGAVEAAIGPDTAAIMVEPVQGEGGLYAFPVDDLRWLRELCDRHGLLLVMDEVQCGMGRTGKLFAHEWAGVTPDVMAVAKGIGGGFPLGAVLATAEAAKGMTAGTHGSTFGGNPLGMAVANAVLDVLLSPGFLDDVQAKASRLGQALARVKDEHPDQVIELRGKGLLMGVRLSPPVGDVGKACMAERLLTVGAGENVLRLLPPLNVTDAEISEAASRLSKALTHVAKASPAVAAG
jgi:acetylornithine/N-succinyldiaminopimelate aminotransferase